MPVVVRGLHPVLRSVHTEREFFNSLLVDSPVPFGTATLTVETHDATVVVPRVPLGCLQPLLNLIVHFSAEL